MMAQPEAILAEVLDAKVAKALQAAKGHDAEM